MKKFLHLMGGLWLGQPSAFSHRLSVLDSWLVARSALKPKTYHLIPRRELSAVGHQPSGLSNQSSALNRRLPTQYLFSPNIYKRIPLILFILVFVSCGAAMAQEHGVHTAPAAQAEKISGTVVSAETGEPLEGATVKIKNTNTTTLTNGRGEFTLTTKSRAGEIEVSFLGYQSQIVAFNDRTKRPLDIRLKQNENALDETIIIAYGQTTKRFNTGSVGRVTAAEIGRQPVANPIAALQGRIPGVEITQQSGRTGSNFNVLIRGQSSIANGNESLYLIDGVPWLSTSLSQIAGSAGSQSPFNSINPNDIESIEVLKDADATAIYGSRGANGVILITTKKGKVGKTEFSINAYTGFSKVGHTMPLMNTQQYLEMRREALANDGLTPTNSNAPDLLLYDQERYTDWKKVLIGNTAKLTDVQVALTGGSNLTQFRMAGAYRRETNVYPGDDANKRGSAQLNLNHRSENNKLQAIFTTNYSNDDNSIAPSDLTSGIYAGPNLKVYEEDGSLSWSENGSANQSNPLVSTLNIFNVTTQNLISNLNLSYEFIPGLKAKVSAGYTNTNTDEKRIYPLISYAPSASRISGQSQFANSHFRSWIVEPQLNYKRSFGHSKLDVLLGNSWQKEILQSTVINASNYSSEAFLFTTAGAANLSASEDYGLYKYQSVFGRINYQLKERYLLNLTGRRDGSSRFGPGRQFANFGAIGAAWIFSEASLIQNHLSALSFGKIRGSYGLTGNDKIGNYRFMNTYGSVRYPYQGISGLVPTRLFNPDYGWESNRKLEFALDLGFINDRVLLSSGWFRNRSGNQLLQYTLPIQTGFSGITRNMPAHVQNSGWEFELNTINTERVFRWSTSFNITVARNKLLEFPDLESSSYASRYAIGESLNIVKTYSYTGMDAETGLWTVDIAEGRSIIQDLNPKFYGGFNNSFQYKGLQLDVFVQFVKKKAMSFISSLPAMPGTRNYNMPVALLKRWEEPGDQTEIQRFGTVASAATARSNYFLSDGIFVDASFIRLKNLALSYQLPEKWMNIAAIRNARIYMLGQNIFTITNYEGNDPEVISMTSLPPLRTMTLGIQISL
jgi:TonB-linked SusC/RagA family outer membrane protein